MAHFEMSWASTTESQQLAMMDRVRWSSFFSLLFSSQICNITIYNIIAILQIFTNTYNKEIF
jgi:hypothetical protein